MRFIDKNKQVYSNKYFIQIVGFNHISQLFIFKKYIQKIFTNKQLNDRFTAFDIKINALLRFFLGIPILRPYSNRKGNGDSQHSGEYVNAKKSDVLSYVRVEVLRRAFTN